MRLQDKVAIITGAGRGIGQATAVKFAHEGARVVVCDVQPELIDETVRMCKESRGDAFGCVADVRDPQSLALMVDATLAKWGRVDCLVNNAGIVSDAQFKNMTDEQFDNVIDINLKGVYNATKAVVNTMLAQQSGVILNASSIVGLYGNFGQTNYVATKAGVIGMTKVWARELGKYGIRANAVAPGFIKTEILAAMPEKVLDGMVGHTPVGRMGEPADVAEAYLWLASDAARFVSGAVLSVDGGLVVGT
jgi:3-oxoacyl-[acyl-carrier protein] reductase